MESGRSERPYCSLIAMKRAKNFTVYVSTFRHFLQYKAISFHCDGYICSIVLPGGTSPALGDFLSAAVSAFTVEKHRPTVGY
jgi:hypothetical protein